MDTRVFLQISVVYPSEVCYITCLCIWGEGADSIDITNVYIALIYLQTFFRYVKIKDVRAGSLARHMA